MDEPVGFLASIQKALVPIVLSVVVVPGLELIGVDLPVDADETIALGIVTSAFVWLFPNGKIGL